jgi:hypothetical protein
MDYKNFTNLLTKSIKKSSLKKWLMNHTDYIDSLPKFHIGLWIALAAGLGLFAELMIIRVHSSYFQLFAYLKNVSLLSCFLGLGVGYAVGSKKPLYTPFVLPLLSIQIVLMYLLRFSHLSTLLQNPISEQLSLGLSSAGLHKQMFIFAFVLFVFLFNAICFIPLGQLASRLMSRQSALAAYSWNLLGSLLGIIFFSLLSLIWSPPLVWFLIAAMFLLLFVYKDKLSIIISILSISVVTIVLSLAPQPNKYDIFSPYQILTLSFSSNALPVVMTNNSYYQRIVDLRPENIAKNETLKFYNDYYSIPYSFKPQPEQVLVVGSGTGNDVAAALRNGAGHVDAVEIDPAILQAGEQLHPERPYQNPKVSAIIDDARSFIRYTNNKYDLIVYGLLDSHTLLSSRGGIRLDSYVYTVEAFKEARSKLKDDGVISLTFALMSGELGRKIYLMLEEAFDGRSPIVYYSQYDGGYTFLAGNGIKDHPINPIFKNSTAFFADSNVKADVSTDDWPFFYMPIRKYPKSSMALVSILLVASLFFVNKFVKKTNAGFSIPCFFLGAGFMLLETKGITELSLYYGSTWYVNSVIIISILIMGFLANIYVMKKGIPPRIPTYFVLFLAVFVSLSFTYLKFFGNLALLGKIIIPVGLTLPLFFSGIVFSSELKKSPSVGVALYSNLLGSMLGGFLEYNSMYFGFKSLYLLAIAMYAFALIGSRNKLAFKQ